LVEGRVVEGGGGGVVRVVMYEERIGVRKEGVSVEGGWMREYEVRVSGMEGGRWEDMSSMRVAERGRE
jgi:hypothetical protein